jgi:hypothetical protein
MNEDKELLALAGAIAANLTGWQLHPPNDGHWAILFKRDEMCFNIARDNSGKRDRINVSTWGWPQYTKYEQGDEPRKDTIFPNSLYDPKEESPSISCAIARGGEAIAREITRRFIPDYERIWKRCAEKAEMWGKAEVEARDNWAAICKAAGQPVRKGSIYAELGKAHLRIENRNGLGHIQIDATPAQVTAIIKALKGGQ